MVIDNKNKDNKRKTTKTKTTKTVSRAKAKTLPTITRKPVDMSTAKWVCLYVSGRTSIIIDQLQKLSFVIEFRQEILKDKMNEVLNSKISHKEQGYNYFFVFVIPTYENISYLRRMTGVIKMDGYGPDKLFLPTFYNIDDLNNVESTLARKMGAVRKIMIGDLIEIISGLFRGHTGSVREINEDNITVEIYVADTPLTVVVTTDSVILA